MQKAGLTQEKRWNWLCRWNLVYGGWIIPIRIWSIRRM